MKTRFIAILPILINATFLQRNSSGPQDAKESSRQLHCGDNNKSYLLLPPPSRLTFLPRLRFQHTLLRLLRSKVPSEKGYFFPRYEKRSVGILGNCRSNINNIPFLAGLQVDWTWVLKLQLGSGWCETLTRPRERCDLKFAFRGK